MLIEAVADSIAAQASGSSAERWIRLGTRMYDILTNDGQDQGPICNEIVLGLGWRSGLDLAATAIRTGVRLICDYREAPKAGTHAALSLAKTLLHPCITVSLSRSQRQSVARSPYAASGNSGRIFHRGLLEEAQRARERGDCQEAIRLAHLAAAQAPDSVPVWYNLQVRGVALSPKSMLHDADREMHASLLASSRGMRQGDSSHGTSTCAFTGRNPPCDTAYLESSGGIATCAEKARGGSQHALSLASSRGM